MMKTGSVATKIALAATLAATTVPACGLAFADEADAPQAVAEAALSESGFPDVDESQWYAEGVAYCVDYGLMSGYSGGERDGYFGVGDTLTRGQLATMLWRLSCPEEAAAYDMGAAVNESDFPDVEDGKYYTAAANWAAEKGVVNGFEEGGHREFRPYEAVTMEQFCCIVANYMHEDTEEVAQEPHKSILTEQLAGDFNDSYLISDWAFGSVATACYYAYSDGGAWVNGYDNGDGTRSLRPQEELTRERAATMLKNIDLACKHFI